jgi:hypothetical protein
MTDIIEIENQYYIRAQSSLADNRTRVLMRGIRGLRSSRSLHPIGLNEQGLFYREAKASLQISSSPSRNPVTTPELDCEE